MANELLIIQPSYHKSKADRTIARVRHRDVTGNPVDERGPVKTDKYYPIHRAAPLLVGQSTSPQLLPTGIKVIDLVCPFLKGGKVGAFGGAGVGERSREGNDLDHEMSEAGVIKQDQAFE